MSKNIVINGKVYKSVAELCRDERVNIHGLSESLVRKRLKLDMSLRDAFSTPSRKSRKFNKHVVYGKSYASLEDVVGDLSINPYGLSLTALNNRLQRGMSLEDALKIKHIIKPTNRKKIVYRGKEYLSLDVLCMDKKVNKFNLSKSTIIRRLKSGMSLEEALSKKANYGNAKVYTLLGKEYYGLESVIRDKSINKRGLGLSYVYSKLNSGMSLESIFGLD